jgi:fatty-acyl-CoA synthase
MTTTLPQLISEAARKFGDEEAIVAPDVRMSFNDIDSLSDQVAKGLVAAGVKRGDHVGLCAGNSARWLVVFFGIVKVGAVCVPINTRLKADEIRYQLGQARVRLLFLAGRVLSSDLLAMFDDVARGMAVGFPQADLPSLETVVLVDNAAHPSCTDFGAFVARGREHALPPPPLPDDPALIQYTSGTTSLPKGAVLHHDSIVRNAVAVADRIGMKRGDRYLSPRPFFHVAGMTLAIVLSMHVGAVLVTMTRFTTEDALALMEAESCSHFSGNDTMFLMLLSHPEAAARLSLRGGWAAATPTIVERAMSELGAEDLVVAYGLSETSPNVAVSDYRDPREDRIAGWMRPHDGLDVRIADPDTGTELASGNRGEIQVRGWTVMSEYFDKPDETARALTPDGFLRTGDVGEMREDGRIRFVGRMKEIIRVGGENVSPAEIENVLNGHAGIAQAQVVGVPDPRLIEVPAAYIVLKPDVDLTIEAIEAWVRPRLAGFKQPRHFALVASFEDLGMTASGKVQKAKLANDAKQRFRL